MSSDKKSEMPAYGDWERPLFDAWKEQGYFSRTPGFGKNGADTYTVVIPPPNVTGMLHMGHALNDTIQDTCVRHARMQGYQTRWILGTDHAGIATQTKVDKKLASEGISRLEIGREKFLEACWDWRKDYGNTIVKQIAGMGCSCDYSDEKFTMSPDYAKAVRKVFCDWYHDGLIYRGRRIVNWCPSCTTAIADDEAEYVDEKGHLWYLRYPLSEPVDGIEYLVVATTRPETMLGDTGVAVSPKDERYKNLVGKTIDLPIVGRKIPIFADYYVDSEFGTGAVKTTPAHDPNDYAMGQRNNLEQINVFDEHAVVVEGYGKFSGMTRDEAREAIVAEFEALGLLDHVEEHDHSVMTCYRCHTKLEPWLSEQWFVAVDCLKERAAQVVENGEVQFHPARWKQVYLDWLANLKDWCISRQRKWGVPIPIFFCKECGEAHIDKDAMYAVADLFEKEGSNAWYNHTAAEILPAGTKCKKCGCTEFDKEKDIMDVWFDSGSSHAAVVRKRDNLQFPADLYLEGNDQYRGWFQSSLLTSVATNGVAPYKAVLTHGMILDEEKRKMSKSLGNGISPQDVIKQYGADVLRLWVASTDYQSDVHISNDILKQISESYRKIRNTARYILGNISDFNPDENSVAIDELLPMDKWALVKLNELINKVANAYDNYEFHQVYHSVRNFCVVDMSNFYLDVLKDRLYTEKKESHSRRAAQTTIYIILDSLTRMIAPILAYTSDEIWKYIPHRASDDGECVMFNEMPKPVEINVSDDFMAKWDKIHDLRDDVKKALEEAVKEKKLKKSLDAKIILNASGDELEFIKSVEPELKNVFIVSGVEVVDNGSDTKIDVELADGEKCERCWEHSVTVGADPVHPTLCQRCVNVLK